MAEQTKAREKMLKLAEKQKMERELLRERIAEFELMLDQKQALELQLERTRGAIEVTKHMNIVEEEGEDMDLRKKLESVGEELKHNEDELAAMETLNQILVIRERMANDEFQDVRKELIKIFEDSNGHICVKEMGELDRKPFIKASNIKRAGEDVENKAVELYSLWDDYLRDPSWHPYKVVMVGRTLKEVLDEEDEKLKELKTDLGDEVYEAVTTALNEINVYNPISRYPIKELWNSNAKRKASLGEAIEYLLNRWKALKGSLSP